jgi:GNAT superfamily N-acetyltransferase
MSAAQDATRADVQLDTRVLGPPDLEEAAALLARGFAEEPGNLVLVPDREARRVMVETSARASLRTLLPRGTVHGATVGGALAAIAVWHAPGVPKGSLADGLRGLAGVTANAWVLGPQLPHAASVVLGDPPAAARLVRWRRRMAARAAVGLTWNLAYLATAPEHRGRGAARALLDRQLTRCDEDGAAVWLEATDPVNPPIYERFGFVTVGHLEDAAWFPGWWVMRREPGGG